MAPMSWLSGWLAKGIGISLTRRIGAAGSAPDPGEKHCVDCGVKRRDHGSSTHVFREIEND